MEQSRINFHISEHASLRAEIGENLRKSDNVIVYSLVSSSTIFWWVKSQDNIDMTVAIASLLPSIIVMLCFSMYRTFISGVFRIANYCKKLENILAFDELGWETHLDNQRKSQSSRVKVSLFHVVFFMQLVLSLYLASETITRFMHAF